MAFSGRGGWIAKQHVPAVIDEFLRLRRLHAFLEVIIGPDAGVYPMVGPGAWATTQ